ncbi:MAG: DUF3365 domain-containing protein [Spirulinaceae cyanobacterium SM2_1_0]|nr:DUF3365 domain-containing protein [Spirulinaceae cyanobacterium SM2_1_0]
MKLQIRIELILLAIFLAGWLSVVGTTYVMEQQQGVENTVNKAEVLMSAAIAARTYTSDEIADPLSEVETQEFLPQRVPSYAAQQLFARLDDEFSGYTYAERVLNPTNPKDLAEGWQVELIQAFIDDPDREAIVETRADKSGRQTLYVAQPIAVNAPSCLECHSTPEVAPASLIRTYGSSGGFGWQLDEIIGTRIVSVPIALAHRQVRESIVSYSLLIASIFLMAYTAVNLLVRRWIIKPLDSIAHLVEQISLRKLDSSPLPEDRSDELGKLSKSINRLLASLQRSLSSSLK